MPIAGLLTPRLACPLVTRLLSRVSPVCCVPGKSNSMDRRAQLPRRNSERYATLDDQPCNLSGFKPATITISTIFKQVGLGPSLTLNIKHAHSTLHIWIHYSPRRFAIVLSFSWWCLVVTLRHKGPLFPLRGVRLLWACGPPMHVMQSLASLSRGQLLYPCKISSVHYYPILFICSCRNAVNLVKLHELYFNLAEMWWYWCLLFCDVHDFFFILRVRAL